MSTQQRPVLSVAPAVNFRLRAVLRDALLSVTRHIPCRPDPRWQWDALAAEQTGAGSGGQMRTAFVVTGMLRAALESAQQKGPDAFRETRTLVSAFLAIQEAEIFKGFDLPMPTCHIQAAAEVTRELSEAQVASVEFAAQPTESNAHRAIEENVEASNATERYASYLARQSWRAPMSA